MKSRIFSHELGWSLLNVYVTNMLNLWQVSFVSCRVLFVYVNMCIIASVYYLCGTKHIEQCLAISD